MSGCLSIPMLRGVYVCYPFAHKWASHTHTQPSSSAINVCHAIRCGSQTQTLWLLSVVRYPCLAFLFWLLFWLWGNINRTRDFCRLSGGITLPCASNSKWVVVCKACAISFVHSLTPLVAISFCWVCKNVAFPSLNYV